jgi:hypothetical protein
MLSRLYRATTSFMPSLFRTRRNPLRRQLSNTIKLNTQSSLNRTPNPLRRQSSNRSNRSSSKRSVSPLRRQTSNRSNRSSSKRSVSPLRGQSLLREQNLPDFENNKTKDVIDDINKYITKKCDGYNIEVNYYDKLKGKIYSLYHNNNNNSVFSGKERYLMICLYHNTTCVSNLFFEKSTINGKKIIEINSFTTEQYEKKSYNSLLRAIGIYVASLTFSDNYIYSSAMNPISAWALIKNYNVSVVNIDSLNTEMEQTLVKNTFPTFRSIEDHYKKGRSLRLKINLDENREIARTLCLDYSSKFKC